MSGGILEMSIEGFWTLEEHAPKEDGTPDVRCIKGYRLKLVKDRALIVFEVTLLREKVPVNPTDFLARRVADILAGYLPQIDPE